MAMLPHGTPIRADGVGKKGFRARSRGILGILNGQRRGWSVVDIVERLRSIDHMNVEECFLDSYLYAKAADEIERLREALKHRKERDCRYK